MIPLAANHPSAVVRRLGVALCFAASLCAAAAAQTGPEAVGAAASGAAAPAPEPAPAPSMATPVQPPGAQTGTPQPVAPNAGAVPQAGGPEAAAPAPVSGPDVASPETTRPPGESAPGFASGAASLLPRDLSPWGMFLSAHIVVKVVMIGLALASFLTWTVALAKGLELAAAKRRLRAALRILAQASSLSDAGERLGERHGLAAPLEAAMTEIRMSAGVSDKEGIKERVASRLERIEAGIGRRMSRGTGVLATVGATAPFVGLFGTVWGIMNSFIGISKQHTTNLAVVAPGIAEALLATALGLAAAIPAVVIYNAFSRSIAGYRALYADATAEILRLVSRDLDRAESPPASKGRTTAALSAAG